MENASEREVKVQRPEWLRSWAGKNNNLFYGCDAGDNICTYIEQGDSGGPIACFGDRNYHVVVVITHGCDGQDKILDMLVKINQGITDWIKRTRDLQVQREPQQNLDALLIMALIVYYL